MKAEWPKCFEYISLFISYMYTYMCVYMYVCVCVFDKLRST